jgi:hypothetical protein
MCPYLTPLKECCHNSKNTSFQERGKKPLAGAMQLHQKNDASPPLVVILENRCLTLFHEVDMVSGIPLVGVTQNEHFFLVVTLFF